MKKLFNLFFINLLSLMITNFSFGDTHTSVVANGNWGTASTWSPASVPSSTDNVIINTNVNVNYSSLSNPRTCNNLTVNSGCILTTNNTSGLQLTVNGTFIVSSGATVIVGGASGGRLVVSGTGKSHSISGTINIYWALRFEYSSTSTSTVTLNSGAIIYTDKIAEGQLAINSGVDMTVLAGAVINNNCIVQTLCGILLDNSSSSLTINGTLNNGANASIYNLGAITINGVCNYTSGFFKSGTGTHSFVYGAAGTLAYVGGAITSTNNEWPATSSPNNVKINSTGNITLHAARTITGTLSLMQNQFVNGTYLTMGNGAIIDRSGGTISAVPTFNTNCNVIYSNTANIISGPELPPATGTILNNLTIQSTSGTTVTLAANTIVKGTLTMTSGDITTGSNILSLGTSTSIPGTLNYSTGNIITGSSGGFKRWFATGTVSNVYFPIGTSSNINMVTLSFTGAPSAGGSLTAKFIATNPGILNAFINDAGYNVETYSQKGYWQIDAANGLTGGTYNLSLRGQGFNPLGNAISSINYPKLRIIKSTNSGSNWIVSGTHLDATGNNLDPVIQRTGLSGFSWFAMGGNVGDENPLDASLPVEITSFTSNVISRDVKLTWTTATETNNAGFEIQTQQ